MYLGKNLCNRASGCIRAKWFFSGKVVVFGQKLLHSGKVVVFGQSCGILTKVVVIGRKWL